MTYIYCCHLFVYFHNLYIARLREYLVVLLDLEAIKVAVKLSKSSGNGDILVNTSLEEANELEELGLLCNRCVVCQ